MLVSYQSIVMKNQCWLIFLSTVWHLVRLSNVPCRITEKNLLKYIYFIKRIYISVEIDWIWLNKYLGVKLILRNVSKITCTPCTSFLNTFFLQVVTFNGIFSKKKKKKEKKLLCFLFLIFLKFYCTFLLYSFCLYFNICKGFFPLVKILIIFFGLNLWKYIVGSL